MHRQELTIACSFHFDFVCASKFEVCVTHDSAGSLVYRVNRTGGT